MDRRTTFVVAVGLFAAHNAEEALTVSRYLRLVAPLAPPPLDRLTSALTPAAVVTGTGLVTLIALGVAAWAVGRPRSPVACWVMLLLQSVVLLNAVPHVVAAIGVRGYVPGLVTAVVVNVPFSWYVLSRAWRETWVGRRAFAALAPAACVVHGPLLALLLAGVTALTRF